MPVNPCPRCGRDYAFPLTGCLTHSPSVCECGQSLRLEVEWDPWAGIECCRDPLDVKVWDLQLSVRAQATLKRLGVAVVRDLLELSRADLSESVAEEVVQVLAAKGLRLPD